MRRKVRQQMLGKNVWRIFAILIFLATMAFTPLQVTLSASAEDGVCPGAATQLKQGDIAVLTIDLNLRVQPNAKADVIMVMPKYAYVTIIAGPKCDGGTRWFETGYNGKDGWAAEVGATGVYHMIPNGSSMPTQNQPNSGQSASSPSTSDTWPDSLIGIWKGSLTCAVNFRPNESCKEKLEVVRETDGNLIVSQDGNSLTTEQETYKEIQETDGSTNYFYCFNQLQTQSGETVIWGELCLRVIDDYSLKVEEGGPGGGEWGTLTRVGEPIVSATPQLEAQGQQTDPCTTASIDNRTWLDILTGVTVAHAKVQCTQYVFSKISTRMANCIGTGYPDAGKWDTWTQNQILANHNPCGVTIKNLSGYDKTLQSGDIIVWDGYFEHGHSCTGGVAKPSDDVGHVAFFLDWNPDKSTFRMDGANWSGDPNKVIVTPGCMHVIHIPDNGYAPSTGQSTNQMQSQNQSTDQNTDKCSQYWWIDPRWWSCKFSGK